MKVYSQKEAEGIITSILEIALSGVATQEDLRKLEKRLEQTDKRLDNKIDDVRNKLERKIDAVEGCLNIIKEAFIDMQNL